MLKISGSMKFMSSGTRTVPFSMSLAVPVILEPNDVLAVTTIQVRTAKSMQVTDLTLQVSFSLHDPSMAPGLTTTSMPPMDKCKGNDLLKSLNDLAISDCAFSTKNTTTLLYASRAILAAKSSFFRTMFKGTWAESARGATLEPIQFDSWEGAAVALVLVHLYSGWLPGEPLPKFTRKLVRDFACDPNALDFATWRNMFDLARMLELKELMLAINRQLVAHLEEEFVEIKNMAEAAEEERDDDEHENVDENEKTCPDAAE
ncbi:hypothetical protein AMAG_16436 [Allomyces macrogynus ATCC 38327]|uniref:BTB domain-containing protein n=1 Tax=Allomyces macrogynus (strain ATCC 38327) TaxID=578462 RepID=A0A0L0TD61_ALLM3|nr:hypothetical protein AMAG_16436 [Allomyces macrogynus ATCC 38327]|eukprot:KNE72677.1 hypothetical protein AMAG_16436 [Allomyces macrogynus ATCC 38327]